MTSGHHEYSKGANAEAERHYRLALQAAIDEANPNIQHSALLWEAACLGSNGDIQRALSRLLDMRLLEHDRPDISFDAQEAWSCRSEVFRCQMRAAGPYVLGQLDEILRDLRIYSNSHSTPPHDIFVLQAYLYRERGIWGEAISYCEKAYANYLIDVGGYSLCVICHLAAYCALTLRRSDAALDWIDLLASVDGRSNEFISLLQNVLQFKLACTEDNRRAMRRHLAGILSVPAGIDAYSEDVRQARVWGAVFDSTAGDPAARDHPARRALSRAPKTIYNLLNFFDYALLALDYRLACLRYVVGLAQNNDQWHQADCPALLHPSDRNEALRRLHRARVAASGVNRRAAYLDHVFECGWRQMDVEKRIGAIQAISSALYKS